MKCIAHQADRGLCIKLFDTQDGTGEHALIVTDYEGRKSLEGEGTLGEMLLKMVHFWAAQYDGTDDASQHIMESVKNVPV